MKHIIIYKLEFKWGEKMGYVLGCLACFALGVLFTLIALNDELNNF